MVHMGQIQKSAMETKVVGREVQEQLVVSWSPIEKMVMDAVEDYLESCAQVILDVEVVERLLRLESLGVSLGYVLKHATRRGSHNFPALRHI